MSGPPGAGAWRTRLASPWVVGALLAHAVFVAVLGVQSAGGLEGLELNLYDRLLARRAATIAADDRIVVVGITERDIRRYGWPLDDVTLANLLSRLTAAGATSVGIDLYRDVPVGDGAGQLEAVLRGRPSLIGAEKFPDATSDGVPPPPALRDSDRIGFTDVMPDPDGLVRRGLLYAFDGDRAGVSLALRVAIEWLRHHGIAPGADADGNPTLGAARFPPIEPDFGAYVGADAGGYQFALDFGGARDSYRRLSLHRALTAGDLTTLCDGRIVLIGVVAQSVNDHFYAPVGLGRFAAGRVPGVLLHAHVVDQLLRLAEGGSRLLTSPTARQELAWLWLWCLLGAAAGLVVRSLSVLGFVALGGAVAVAGLGALAFRSGIWMPMVAPATGWLLSSAAVTGFLAMRERADRALLMRLFERHVSPDVAGKIWRERQELLDQGRLRAERLTATVLFSDLVGFTTLSEKLEPEALLARLNEYMQAMSDAVIEHDGMIDKYIGDAVMAVYGVPFARQTADAIALDAANAVRTALAMRTRLDTVNARWQAEGIPAIAMRVGIHTGPVVAGSLGGRERLEYTVLGDTVNIASRLESFDKNYNPDGSACRILIGGATRRSLGEQFVTEPVGSMDLKGKDEPVEIHRVTGLAAPPGA